MGYYGNPQGDCRRRSGPDGWLHTGDVATMDDDGYFTIVDRMKDMILTAGFNVYPAEIERVLCGHAAVALAAGRRHPGRERRASSRRPTWCSKPGAQASRGELVAHCRRHLAAYKVPRGPSSLLSQSHYVPWKNHAPAAERYR